MHMHKPNLKLLKRVLQSTMLMLAIAGVSTVYAQNIDSIKLDLNTALEIA